MKKAKGPKKLPYKGWTPMKDGVSQSLLQKFSNDRDRFHKHAVLGLREVNRKEAMEYGTLFHKLIELGAAMGKSYSKVKLMQYMQNFLKKRYPSAESLLLAKIALVQYDEYRKWEATREKYRYIAQEPVFNEPFNLPPLRYKTDCIEVSVPPGITIPLRGRIDEVIEKDGMWIQENKTKSKINISLIRDTLHTNIQVMFYAFCSELKYGRPCKGVIYNIIRKPGQKQKQKESEINFLKRVKEEIEANPLYYFTRLTYEFPPGALERWKREELLPLLYQVFLWWKSIEANPTNPWVDAEGNVNPFHGRRSFGIYEPMTSGKGDFFDLIVYGKQSNLVRTTEMFPELADEDEEDDE